MQTGLRPAFRKMRAGLVLATRLSSRWRSRHQLSVTQLLAFRSHTHINMRHHVPSPPKLLHFGRSSQGHADVTIHRWEAAADEDVVFAEVLDDVCSRTVRV